MLGLKLNHVSKSGLRFEMFDVIKYIISRVDIKETICQLLIL